MPRERTSHFIYFTFVAIAVLLLWAWNVNAAHADTGSPQLSIAGNGQTMIKSATVVSVEGLTIVVSTNWGATQFVWKVETTGSTKFYPAGPSREMLSALKKGDSINITGVLERSAASTIHASAVRNLSLVERLAPTTTEEVAMLPAIPSTGTPEESPSSGGNNALVVAGTSTALLAWLWRYLYGDPAALAIR